MRLPASITAQPPDAADPSHLAATHVDPTEVSDVEQTDAERKPFWGRVSAAVFDGAFGSVAAAFIAVTGAIYVGMYHAPWVKSLASHTPTAAQAGNAMSVAVAAGPANASTPVEAPPAAEAPAEPAPPDRVAAARDRMEQRIYSQVPRARARTVAERETIAGEDDSPPARSTRRHNRGTRSARNGTPFNPSWYKGA